MWTLEYLFFTYSVKELEIHENIPDLLPEKLAITSHF